MKNAIFTFAFCLCLVYILKSQDIIVMETGDEIKAKVLEITLDEIKYKMFNNPDGPTIDVLKKDVFMIKYKNGTKQLFEEQNVTKPEQQQQDKAQIDYDRGYNDAVFSYKANGAKWGTMVASVPLVLPGLITAIVVSNVRPAASNLKMDSSKLKNKDYVSGYKDSAFKIKKKKTWEGFCIVGGFEIVILLLSSL